MANKYALRKTGVGRPCCYCLRVQVKAGTDEAFDNPGLITSIEHKIYPKSKGGGNDKFNIDFACKRCNQLRGNIAIELFEPFARVVIQQYPDAPDVVLRDSLREFIYNVATLSLKNTRGVSNATLATLVYLEKQVSRRENLGARKNK